MSAPPDEDRGESAPRSKRRASLQILASLAIAALAVAVSAWLLLTGEPAPQREPTARAVPVEVTDVQARSLRPSIAAYGELRPARRLSLPAQVGGRVVATHPALEVGGRITAGETLVEIEKADFELAARRAEARLEEARAELDIEQGRQAFARQELESFERFEAPVDAPDNLELILRGPQLRRIRAGIQRAQADLERARLDLERATITAPFDSIVEAEQIEIGQVLQPGSVVAELLGTGRAHVVVRIEARHLQYLDVPGWNAETGSTGTVRYRLGETAVSRPIRILHLAGSLDETGRMARLLCELDEPFGPAGSGAASVDELRPMLFNAFVEVDLEIAGQRRLFEIPAGALRNRGRLFVMTPEDTLAIREPTVFLRSRDRVYLSDGLQPGDRLVTSLIADPIEGMPLRVAPTRGRDDADANGSPGRP